MKSAIVFVFIFLSVISIAQVRKDSTVKTGKDSMQNKKIFKERQDSSFINFLRFLQNNNLYFNPYGTGYISDLPKPTLKEEFSRKHITEKDIVEENLKKIAAEIKVEIEDKRPWWLKILEDFLGIASKVAAVALAVGQLLK